MRKSADMEEWRKKLQPLVDELGSIPSAATFHNQLRQLLEDWTAHRERIDHDCVIRLSFLLGKLSDKTLRTDVAGLIEQLMQSNPAPANGPASVPEPTPAAGAVSIEHRPQRGPHPWADNASAPAHAADEEQFISLDPAPIPGSAQTEQAPVEQSMPRGNGPTPDPALIEAARGIRPDDPDRPAADEDDQANAPAFAGVERRTAAGRRSTTRRPTVPRTTAEPQPAPPQAADDNSASNPGNGADGDPTYPEVERRVNSAYRLHLDRKHGEIEKLQELLEQKAIEAMAQNKEFGALLEIERSALEQASSVSEIDDMKQILIGGTDELIAGQRDLADKLRHSFEYLQIIKTDSERLHDELNKVRLLSMTDEHTGLPNRRALMRRLDDEISRSQRYDAPLALALIDLDYFKEINDRYGHPAGDAVLSWYAENALPMFRHYDMVARYGGEEFAVLFPGTTGDGARRALAKMRHHVSGAICQFDGEEIDVPTFSAGVTVYREGDTEPELMKRADKALYRAKSLGRDRIEIDKQVAAGDVGLREP